MYQSISMLVYQFLAAVQEQFDNAIASDVAVVRDELMNIARACVNPRKFSDYAFNCTMGSKAVDDVARNNLCALGYNTPFLTAKIYRIEAPLEEEDRDVIERVMKNLQNICKKSLVSEVYDIADAKTMIRAGVRPGFPNIYPLLRFHECNNRTGAPCGAWLDIQPSNSNEIMSKRIMHVFGRKLASV